MAIPQDPVTLLRFCVLLGLLKVDCCNENRYDGNVRDRWIFWGKRVGYIGQSKEWEDEVGKGMAE